MCLACQHFDLNSADWITDNLRVISHQYLQTMGKEFIFQFSRRSWGRNARLRMSAGEASLFRAKSYSGQRERKSVWQGFQSKICELVSGKLSKCSYIHSYTHLITSSAVNECLLVHNFQNNCSTECH